MKTPTPSAHSRDANALAYFVGTAFVAILFFLPLCTLLNLYVADGLLSALTGDPLRLSRDNDFAAAVVCFSLTIPGICGGRLAAHAHIAATFIARYLPLLLPLPLFLAVLILCVRSCFGSAPLYRLAGLAFLLTYGPFLLNFLNWSRACPPARGRRAGMACLLLVLAPFCAGLAVSLHDTQATLITGDHDAVGVMENEDFWKAFTPDRPDNALARPSAPPSLRLGETLPRLNGILAARPLYVAAIRAVSRLDADGRPLPDKTWIERLARAGVLTPHYHPDSVDIFFGLPPSERQLAALRAEWLTPVVRPVAHEGLIFFVHKDNPVRSLTSEQLRRIYTGEIANWQEVGGHDERILPFQHEAEDENQILLERLILRGEEAAPPLREEYSPSEHSLTPESRVARYRKRTGALGFGLRRYLADWFPDGDIRLLAVDGVTPTDANLRDGSYPLALPLCLITCRPLNREGHAFRDWLLGPEGRDLIRRAGYLPWEDENGGESDGDAGKGRDRDAPPCR
ncbi:substrate-binding domain-containing protein [uncultured Desulfovibrio sp.]|uniref:substrate-binding domain-containing protein n=1 Tax=uncultured Desulfovibrio sp. TaxID=167968 RepID=UPI0026330F64|nr:substrate-binding domain-containing protein [uncultured Desulfovibrio sp.]